MQAFVLPAMGLITGDIVKGGETVNKASQIYWDEFWKSRGQEKQKSVSSWQFGDNPDYLAKLVIDGIKTATCSGLVFYEIENEPLPAVGDYSLS